jgi:hypothetical protein
MVSSSIWYFIESRDIGSKLKIVDDTLVYFIIVGGIDEIIQFRPLFLL